MWYYDILNIISYFSHLCLYWSSEYYHRKIFFFKNWIEPRERCCLQQELSVMQKSLKNTKQMRDMALAACDKIQTELSKVSDTSAMHFSLRAILITWYLWNTCLISILVALVFQVPSCERMQQISIEILLRSHSSSQLEGLDFKALIAKLKVADVHCTTAEEKTEVSKLKAEVEKAQVVRY